MRTRSDAWPTRGCWRGISPSLAGAVGFRNVLVHGYAEVDDRRVVDHLARLEELRRFVAAMTVLLGPDDT